jgi:exodeoxyribonuclease III
MKRLTVATWNINSVRLRIGLVARLVRERSPDIICLQETKVADPLFPMRDFRELGYEHAAINGQAGYHGVATLSRIPFRDIEMKRFCGKEDARHVRVTIGDGVELHNFYVPAGGDEPDPEINEKFGHKLSFLTEMREWFAARRTKTKNRLVALGDFNVAPLEHDVWSHRQLLKVVSHTPVEVAHLSGIQNAHDWIDVTRAERPEPEKLFTWWSYRARDWKTSNRGRRLDHIWVTPALEGRARNVEILTEARGWERPSDHVPVLMNLDVGE